MYLKAEEFRFLTYLYESADMSDNDRATLGMILGELQKRHEASNEKTRKYIAERRKVDKNYARPKTR